jgi:hypothetical protein
MRAMRKLPVVSFCRSRLIQIFGNALDFFPKSEAYSAPSRTHRRGGSRSSRTWSAGCDGRFGGARDSFVRTNGTEADAKARGPGLPTLRSSRVVTSRAATGARKPGSRGERAINVKTIAQGMPDVSAGPVVTAACFFCCRRAMGCGQHPAFPAPSWIPVGTLDASLGHVLSRECRSVSFPRHAPPPGDDGRWLFDM